MEKKYWIVSAVLVGILVGLAVPHIMEFLEPKPKENYNNIAGEVNYSIKNTDNGRIIKIYNSKPNSVILHPIVYVDKGLHPIVALPGPYEEIGDNFVKFPGALKGFGTLPNREILDGVFVYSEIRIWISDNTEKIVVDDLRGGEPVQWGDDMEKVVINLTE